MVAAERCQLQIPTGQMNAATVSEYVSTCDADVASTFTIRSTGILASDAAALSCQHIAQYQIWMCAETSVLRQEAPSRGPGGQCQPNSPGEKADHQCACAPFLLLGTSEAMLRIDWAYGTKPQPFLLESRSPAPTWVPVTATEICPVVDAQHSNNGQDIWDQQIRDHNGCAFFLQG